MRIDPAATKTRSISLTPLIDVVFLLLVFFMLASTFLKYSGIDLATASTGEAAADKGPVIVVRVLGAGRLEIDGAAAAIDEFGTRLATTPALSAAATIAVQPAGDATVEDIALAVETARRAPARAVVIVR
ncbi:MAG: biopolymer transporter ExbD [Hyphomicrobiales bacterium]